MKLSIIIVGFNSKKYLPNCLSSIKNNLRKIKYEIIFVDNASKDTSVILIQNSFKHIKMIQNKGNLGFAKANNQAIKKAKGEYILLLNPDTLLIDNTIEKMISYMEKNKKIGVMGPYILDKRGRTQMSYNLSPFIFPATTQLIPFALEKILPKKSADYLSSRLKYKKPKEVALVSGACLLTRKTVFERVGLLDEGFFMYGEDGEFCFRVRKKGYKVVFYPHGIIIHFGGKSSKFLKNKRLIEAKSYAKYFHKSLIETAPAYHQTKKLVLRGRKFLEI